MGGRIDGFLDLIGLEEVLQGSVSGIFQEVYVFEVDILVVIQDVSGHLRCRNVVYNNESSSKN
jgi:hypothetical protein